MKIKQVMAETHLTDRAIRIYIDNGLISPDFEENYSGRKSYRFSSEDVSALKNIAILRKVGFSISEIKTLSQGGEESIMMLKGFVEKKETQLKEDEIIYKTLKRILKNSDITFESICKAFSKTELQSIIPENELSPKEKEELANKNSYIITGLVCFALWLLMFTYEMVSFIKKFEFFNIEKDCVSIALVHFSIHLVACLTPMTLFLINRIPDKNKSEKTKRRNGTASAVISVMLLPVLTVAFFNTLFSFIVTPVCSLTENPKDYKQVSLHHSDRRLFPATIPHNATDVSFFYRYRDAIDSDSDTVAQWTLPYEDYETAKNEAINYTAEITHESKKGDWHCVYFEEFSETGGVSHFYYLIFAYNDKTNSVRYIASHGEWEHTPYYLSLDW